jgi:hypothetical protein
MNKVLLIIFFMFVLSPLGQSWAQNSKEKPQWVLDHEKEMRVGSRSPKVKPVRKVSGTAKRGAKQVSPPPKIK